MCNAKFVIGVELSDERLSENGLTAQQVLQAIQVSEQDVIDGIELFRSQINDIPTDACFIIGSPMILEREIVTFSNDAPAKGRTVDISSPVVGIVPMPLSRIIESDNVGFEEALSLYLTGTTFLVGLKYEVVGSQPGDVVLLQVTGQFNPGIPLLTKEEVIEQLEAMNYVADDLRENNTFFGDIASDYFEYYPSLKRWVDRDESCSSLQKG